VIAAAATHTGSQWLWYLSRGSGLVLLVLFSLVFVLGVVTRGGSRRGRLPVAEMHRTLSLFAVALLVLHVVTAISDPYVSIGWLASVVPFVSHYEAVSLGLGTLAVDLAGAVVVTSVLRHRLGFRAWRAIHWLAYVAWPLAFAHSLRAGHDVGIGWVWLIEWGSATGVATAVLARLLGSFRTDRRHAADGTAISSRATEYAGDAR
jgi:sulfoxide reductase heme-binding subunit YedZ